METGRLRGSSDEIGPADSTTVAPRSERFMGWATERAQSISEETLGRAPIERGQSSAAQQRDAVSLQHQKRLSQLAQEPGSGFRKRTKTVDTRAHRVRKERVSTGKPRSVKGSGRFDPKLGRETRGVYIGAAVAQAKTSSSADAVMRRGSAREPLVASRGANHGNPNPGREYRNREYRALESRRETSVRLGSRSTHSRVASKEMGRSPRLPVGRQEKRQGSDGLVYAAREQGQRGSSRALRREERLLNERLKHALGKLARRLPQHTSRRSGSVLASKVNQMVVDQLALLNKMIEILDDVHDRQEEIGRGRAARVLKNRRRVRLTRFRVSRLTKRKQKGSNDPVVSKAPPVVIGSQTVSGAKSPPTFGQPIGLAQGAHRSGPSRSLDIFQSKVDDDSDSEADALL
jgi:hypothetical protein